MIVARRKPFPEIKGMLDPYSRVLVAGCGTCVAVCLAGGEKEAGVLASQLMIAAGMDKKEFFASAATVERQCDREFLELFRDRVTQVDAVVSLACGAGIQFFAEMYPQVPVFPGVDTSFIGVAEDAGEWSERCRSCNQCYLGITGGICPVTMCSKGLLNGPCSGPIHGKCEVDPERNCAWIMIYERLEQQSRIALQETPVPPMDHGLRLHPSRLIHSAYKRRFNIG
ncbi:MAG: methylenetetrahydrofolate reductase C-terminal domain-containing protein [Thermodesulfobacteriota bacterium]